ncbi:MAG: hypothetical protein U0V02_12750 [Anaerolineales bacterium]
MNKKFLGLVGILFFTLACGLGTPSTPLPAEQSVETVVAATFQALTAIPPVVEASATTPAEATQDSGQLTPDGTPVNMAEVSFLIPNGIANDASSTMTTEVEFPYINPSNGDMPQHVKVLLNLYALNGTLYEPHILIFRSDEYAQYTENTANIISAMQSLQYVDGQPLPESLGSDFMAQTHAINFKNGHGVRYLTQVFTNFNPVNNSDLIYYYQGITDDGKYYVEAILPIGASFLAADDNINTPLPADGIPFDMNNFQGYLDAVAQRLNSTDTFSFTPYLDYLDAMIESMQVTGY